MKNRPLEYDAFPSQPCCGYNCPVTKPHEPVAVYPGSFDPFHVGHVAIVERATRIFPKVVVGILLNAGKDALFSPAERAEMVREIYADNLTVEVRSFSGLLVNFLQEIEATIIIRGMRAVSDFEYEFQLASMNRHLTDKVETAFLTPTDKYTFISSTLVREVAQLGGDVTGFVSPKVNDALLQKVGRA